MSIFVEACHVTYTCCSPQYKVYAIPEEEFSMEYVEPKVLCVSTHGRFTQDRFVTHPNLLAFFSVPKWSVIKNKNQIRGKCCIELFDLKCALVLRTALAFWQIFTNLVTISCFSEVNVRTRAGRVIFQGSYLELVMRCMHQKPTVFCIQKPFKDSCIYFMIWLQRCAGFNSPEKPQKNIWNRRKPFSEKNSTEVFFFLSLIKTWNSFSLS